jgi:23S rRNA pseudouridine1911/1915/1917 synthase
MATRTFVIARAERGRSVAAVLRSHLQLAWPAARRLVRAQQVRLDGTICVDATRPVRPGQRLEVHLRENGARANKRSAKRPRQVEPAAPSSDPAPRPVIRYADAQVVVVEKPAGLTTVRHAGEAADFGPRARRFLPPTLADLLPGLLAEGKGGKRPRLRAVHRLDKETSGLVVFARTAEAERDLGRQMRAHNVERRYMALVRGRPRAGRIESSLVADRGDGRRGSGGRAGEGKRAVTHVKVLEELGGYALVECRLETGRTHQVRIHLGERGNPLCGERVYDRPLHGRPLPDGSDARRPMLHAASLGFRHPATGKQMAWTSPLPKDMARLLATLCQRTKDVGRRTKDEGRRTKDEGRRTKD